MGKGVREIEISCTCISSLFTVKNTSTHIRTCGQYRLQGNQLLTSRLSWCALIRIPPLPFLTELILKADRL